MSSNLADRSRAAGAEPRAAGAPVTRIPRTRGRRLRWIAPLLVLALAASLAGLLVATRPTVVATPPEILPPLVRVLVAERRNVDLRVFGHGTVEPRMESELAAEVAGRVAERAPSLVEGGFFEAGEVLVRLDARDYEVALEKARATLALREAEARLAERDLDRRRALAERDVASAADLDSYESRAQVARAALRQARAELAQARLDRSRTEITASFAGRVRKVHVDVGDFVSRGTPLAVVYGTDAVEVRLPLPQDDLAYLGLPLDFHAAGAAEGPPVTLRARVAGSDRSWRGTVARVEGEVDRRTRMATVVAVVPDPYGSAGASASAALPAGLFVEAEIEGRTLESAVVLPREAVRDDGHVLVVDAEDRLRFRTVEIAQRSGDTVVVVDGVAHGERVCVSRLDAVTEGMRVRVAPEPESAS